LATSADDRQREARIDAQLASTLSKTEVMVLNFYQEGCLSRRRGQKLLNMLRHPQFRVEDVQSASIVQLLRRLERPFKESKLTEYNLWKPGDGNQKLVLVVRDYLEVFREIMREPRWKDQFDLVARAIFDHRGKRLIGTPCSALNWERIQKMLGFDVAVGLAQMYFDGTFMGATVGVETGYVGSLNLSAAAKSQHAAVKLYALLPTYDKDAAAKHLSPQQIKKREMDVHQACIGVIVRDLNKYSDKGGEQPILCPDGKVYSMLVIMLALALDHEATEQHCLKAANGCLSCDCPEQEFASWTRRSGAPKLVENVVMKIKEASAELLNKDGTIRDGCIGRVHDWEKANRIKLHYNNWFDVRTRFSFVLCGDETLIFRYLCAVLHSRRAIPVVYELCVVFHAYGHFRPVW
jgi:hypothetical protein